MHVKLQDNKSVVIVTEGFCRKDLGCFTDWALLHWLHLASSSLISILLRQRWWMFTTSLFVREFSSLGQMPDLEWRRAGIDNGAAKWPLSCRRETWRKPLRGPPLSLTQAGQDVERESADRRRYSQAQNSWTQLDTVCTVQGMGARFS